MRSARTGVVFCLETSVLYTAVTSILTRKVLVCRPSVATKDFKVKSDILILFKIANIF